MSIKSLVLGLLTPILDNTWAVELPPDPAWPAVVFDIATEPEDGWVMGGGYDQHGVTVIVLARTQGEIEALVQPIRAALEGHEQSMGIQSHGDADYEPDPAVYAYHLTAILRTPAF
ncbi:hypothetical protein [uncultured Azohydromonas sp.]|mgnify:CR=1 FL=1|jgi:hypothetical protein|uniref:tail completion protein gp17 n=1 Tax=uncultured Azohydromonas sp. TaxID=487342 RepID=UPI00263647DA|nr:hypothetical protein [uncultured Azohydromonas sp.]